MCEAYIKQSFVHVWTPLTGAQEASPLGTGRQRREPGGSTGGGDQKEHKGKETNSGTGENARQGVGAGEA